MSCVLVFLNLYENMAASILDNFCEVRLLFS